jgi:uncharacterized protein YwgA
MKVAFERLQSSVPERSTILLFVLNQLGEIVTELKLQKLIFQIQNKAKAPKGYRYFKHYYGPYSRELNMDTFTLMKEGLLEKRRVLGEDHEYSVFKITEKGRTFFKENMVSRLSPGLIKRMDATLDTYSGYNHYKLAQIVYEEWKINKPSKVQAEIDDVKKDLQATARFWEAAYFPECPAITYFLSYLDYSQEALEKATLVKDVVVKSVLVGACQELQDAISEIAEICSKKEVCPLEAERGVCRNIDPSVAEVFHFIEDFCENNRLLPKLCHRDLTDLTTKEEYKRLQKAVQTYDNCYSS